MSAIEGFDDEDLPATTIKNRSGYADTLHRQDPDAEEPLPACEEKDRPDAEFRQVGTRHHLPFNDLCRNGRCFGEELIADGGEELTVQDVEVAVGDGDLLLAVELADVRVSIAAPRTSDAADISASIEAMRPTLHDAWERQQSLLPPLRASEYERLQTDGGLDPVAAADRKLAALVEHAPDDVAHELVQVRQMLVAAKDGGRR